MKMSKKLLYLAVSEVMILLLISERKTTAILRNGQCVGKRRIPFSV